MAYAGYLVKIGATELPMKYIQLSSYTVTPNQRLDIEAERDATGVLHREVVDHTASKIEFSTPYIKGSEVAVLNAMLQAAYTDVKSRSITIEYFDPETNGYKTADCYMPDVEYNIYSVGLVADEVLYNPVRYAFIEY